MKMKTVGTPTVFFIFFEKNGSSTNSVGGSNLTPN